MGIQNAFLTESPYLKRVPKRKVKVRLNLQNFAWQPCYKGIKGYENFIKEIIGLHIKA